MAGEVYQLKTAMPMIAEQASAAGKDKPMGATLAEALGGTRPIKSGTESQTQTQTQTQTQSRVQDLKEAPPLLRRSHGSAASAGARAAGASTAGSAVPRAAVTAEQAQATKRITLG